MIVAELLALPPWVSYEGIEFELQLFSDGPELRLAYVIASVADNSPHKEQYDVCSCWANKVVDPDNPPNQGFLMLYECIETDADLCWAARSMYYWLIQHGFHEFVYGKSKP